MSLKEVDIDTKYTATPCDIQCGEDLSANPGVDRPLPNKDTTPISTVNTRKQTISKFVERRQIFVTNLWDQEHELKPLFSKFGEIESIGYITQNGIPTGAVIKFVRGDSVVKALRGRPIKTKQKHEFVVEKKPKIYDDALKISIANIMPGMTHVDLVEAFQKFGAIQEIYVNDGKPAYGFVVFQTAEDVSRALAQKFVKIPGKGQVMARPPDWN